MGIAAGAALAVSVLVTVPAGADEGTPAREQRLDADARAALADRLEPLGPIEESAAPASRSAELSEDMSAAFVPPGSCYGPQYGDPNEPGDVLFDAVSYSLSFECISSVWTLGVDTADSIWVGDLGWLDLWVDTNGNLSDGCLGSDYAAVIFSNGIDMYGGMFRTPSCDDSRWTEVANAGLQWLQPGSNQVGMSFNAGPLANSSTLRWEASIVHIDDDVIDFMPDTGQRSAPGNPCGGRCFFLTNGVTGGAAEVAFKDDQPAHQILIGDWNADEGDSLGFRYNNSYALKNTLAPTAPDITFAYGKANDVVLVGDWDGDGTDTLAVRRGNIYHLKNSYGGGAADITVAYGRSSDVVLVGDWDGDGTDTLAVRRGSHYYIKNSFTGGPADQVVAYGRSGDTVLVGDWDGDGDDTLGVRRGRMYYLKNTIAGGTADSTFAYGRENDLTFVGDWNADLRDSLGVRR